MELFLNFLPIVLILNFVLCLFLILKKINYNRNLSNQKRTMWILIIVLIPFIGSIAYLLDKENRIK